MKYPGWNELTLNLRKEFYKYVGGFDNQKVLNLLNEGKNPEIFQLCKDLDSARYFRFISDQFLPKSITPLYRTFIDLLSGIAPPFLVTTNVDEALEAYLPTSAIVQRTNFTRCIELIQKRAPFIAKLHGSVSSIESTIFSTNDYRSLLTDDSYLRTLENIFASCTVIFLGYGVRDEYIVRLLLKDAAIRNLFGNGPHFVVTNSDVSIKSLHRIKYDIKFHPDHRAALVVLDLIRRYPRESNSLDICVTEQRKEQIENVSKDVVPTGKTAYYLSDLSAPGTWHTSEEITATNASGVTIEGMIGLGFTNDEIPFSNSTGLHDIAVGLVCFDYIYLPLTAMNRAFISLGEDLFRELIKQNVLHFIHDTAVRAILFRPGDVIGSLADLVLKDKEDDKKPEPLSTRIRRILNPIPGKEVEAELFFEELANRTSTFKGSEDLNLPSLTRGSLLMPAIPRLLGIGDAILPSQVPRWLRYSYLRLAHLVETAALCAEYGIQAVKVPFGGTQLTSAAFGVQIGNQHADQLASYVVSGSFNSYLGAVLLQNKQVFRGILLFRNSAEGESFREEVAQVLLTESGREFNAAVNAGLRQAIPFNLLQKAHDQLLRLVTESPRVTPVPAVWGDWRQSDTSTRYWRNKSKRLLLQMCATRGIGKNSPCICGSGEKLRLCCLPPLRN